MLATIKLTFRITQKYTFGHLYIFYVEYSWTAPQETALFELPSVNFHSLFVFRGHLNAPRFHAERLCLFSARWRRRCSPPCREPSAGAADWSAVVAGGCCDVDLKKERERKGVGETDYKNPSRLWEDLTLEEENQQQGLIADRSRGPPNPPLYLQINRRFFVISPRAERTICQLPSTSAVINAKRNQRSARKSGSLLRIAQEGEESDEKHQKAHGPSPWPFSMHPLCARGTMKPEITAAVSFLSRFLRVKGHVNDRQVQTFNQSLQEILAGKKKINK